MQSILPKINSKEIHPLLNKIVNKLGSIKNKPDLMKSFGIESIEYNSDFFNNSLTVETSTDVYLIQTKSFGLSFSIQRTKNKNKSNISSLLNKEDYIYELTGDDDLDNSNIIKLIKEVGDNPAEDFITSDHETYLLFMEYNAINVFDPDICHWFIKYLGLQLGAITMSDYRKIKNEIPFESNAIFNENSSALIQNSFEQSFKALKKLNYVEDERFDFNDCDNTAFFVERGDVQAVVHTSQNFLFVTAKNVKTNVIKIWLAMQIQDNESYPLIERIQEDTLCYDEEEEDENESKLDIIKYVAYIADSHYGFKYDYPVELEGEGFLKSYDFYIDNFDYDGKYCLYRSDAGFNPYNTVLGAMAEFDIQSVHTNVYEENGLEIEIINLSSIPTNSLEYFFRSRLFENSRANAFHYLFMGYGNGFSWDGEGFSTFEMLKKDLPTKALSLCYTPLSNDTLIDWKLFVGKIPDNISGEWRKALFEFIFYIKEFGETYIDNESYIENKDNIIAYYNNYYDQEVVDRIKNSRI